MRKSFVFFVLSGLFVSANVSAQGCEPGKHCQQQQVGKSGHGHQQANHNSSFKKQANASNRNQAHQSSAKQTSKSSHSQHKSPAKQKVYKHPNAKSKGTYYVSANRLNVRGAPGKGGKVKGHFTKGQALAVYAVVDGWAKVYFNGQYLWVSNQYLHIKL
ncbi:MULTISPECIES: SH3 domain-containing protein [unclassified Vibrio]|uniref:SH3 domain-containing protein n=1 Tax=Vibrio sp. HB236076 TaxID=3232307 RepID=A0AB39HJ36_9VIBR|nr:SH3 domain-containing protein [Vibrio sp. HB161653]MDP5254973.1 SH3 domain-containing protein [Vibrio sp. HB161653]